MIRAALPEFRKRLNARLGEAVFLTAQKDLVNGDIERRRAVSLATKAVSLAVVATPFLCIALGLWLMVLSFPNLILTVINGAIVGLGLTLLPKRDRNLPKAFTRAELPEIFKLLDEIASELGTEPVTGVHLIGDLNAYMLHTKNDRFIGIGAVLWHALPTDQRVAIVAHEFAHQLNGDPARTGLTKRALDTLEGWLWYLEPDTGEVVVDLALLPPYLIAAGIYRLLLRLMFMESQRAEFLADAIGARVAGADALQNALKTISLDDRVAVELRGMHVNRTQGGIDIVHRLANAVAQTPHDEREIIMDRVLAEKMSVDATHPPTAYRLAFLDLLPDGLEKLSFDQEHMSRIDAELAPHFAVEGNKILKAIGDDW